MAKAAQRKPPIAASKDAAASASPLPWILAIGAIILAMVLPNLWSGSDAVPPKPPKSPERGGTPAANAARPIGCDPAVEEHLMCPAWHKAGFCRLGKMQSKQRCPRTCGLCEGVPPRNPQVARSDRCRRDNVTAAVPQGELTPLFERVLASYPEYSPEALSTSPYVVLLRDFITPDEAMAFQRVCQPKFERSLAGDQLNPVRTSYQCWCNFPGCFTDPDVHNVTHRINELLNIPYNNGEDLQIVRYESGQFYRRHHDQNTAVWAPQGPRVLTFFMYLNDPASGGETAFPALNNGKGLVVEPKLGSAILWPSTLDERPMDADPRTDHEAMPVHAGIKYGANMWVHQFDFKTPSERGCELTYVNTAGRTPSREHQYLVADGRVPSYEETVQQAMRPGQ